MENSFESLLKLLEEKIHYGELLIIQLESIQSIEGVVKLQRKIRQELEFLLRLQVTRKVKHEQLACSNLRQLGALVECALRKGVIAVCKIFHINDENKLIVDVISDEGKTWTKVIARNPKSLSAMSLGKASYGVRSILDQAKDYLLCAKIHPYMYQAPKVYFEFVSGIEENLASKLKNLGIIVNGNVLPNSNFVEELDDSDSDDTDINVDESDPSNGPASDSTEDLEVISEVSEQAEKDGEITILNLDVTAMMAYISNMTNGHCKYVFKQDVLTQQAAWECLRPVKPILEKLFEGKTLICCETACTDFRKIVETLGGPEETQRAEELLKRVKVYPDDHAGNDDHARNVLKVRGRVRLRSKIVFNFGYRMKAVTVSANDGFVRAAAQQGVLYTVFIHESRALTEGKQENAAKVTVEEL